MSEVYVEFSVKGRLIAKVPTGYNMQELVDSLEVDVYSNKVDIHKTVIHEIDITG